MSTGWILRTFVQNSINFAQIQNLCMKLPPYCAWPGVLIWSSSSNVKDDRLVFDPAFDKMTGVSSVQNFLTDSWPWESTSPSSEAAEAVHGELNCCCVLESKMLRLVNSCWFGPFKELWNSFVVEYWLFANPSLLVDVNCALLENTGFPWTTGSLLRRCPLELWDFTADDVSLKL